MKLNTKEAKALKEVEDYFLMYFEELKNDSEGTPDTLESAVHELEEYLKVRGLLDEDYES